jgi:hypothetical protein
VFVKSGLEQMFTTLQFKFAVGSKAKTFHLQRQH